MFTEDVLLNSAMWFFAGAFAHKILNSILFYSKSIYIVQKSYLYALDALWMANEAYTAFSNAKHEVSFGSDKKLEEIQEERIIDKELQKLWQISSVSALITMCPPKFRGALGFEDWHSAMRFRNRTNRN